MFETVLTTTRSEIIWRHAKSSPRIHKCTTGWCTVFGSVGHRVKIHGSVGHSHKLTPATSKDRGDLEIKDYVVLQKPPEQADRLPPPRTLILDFTLTWCSTGGGWEKDFTLSPIVY